MVTGVMVSVSVVMVTGDCPSRLASPSGKKYRSKPELARALGNTVDLTYFDFHTGKMSSAKKDLRMKKVTAQVDYG